MKREKNPNQKAFKIITKKAAPAPKPAVEPAPEVDTAKAVAFAMSIAQEMKNRQRKVDEARKDETDIVFTKQNRKYSERDLQCFQQKLVALRDSLSASASTMRDNVLLNDADDVEPDGGDGTSQSMRLSTISHIEQSNKTITDIDEALRRVEDGSYGVCMTCGQLIVRERLLHSPFVKTCTDCQRALEASK